MSARQPILNKLADGRYQARVWDDKRTPQPGYTSRRFTTRGDASAWIKVTTAGIARGVRSEPVRGRTTVATEAQRWLELRKATVSGQTYHRQRGEVVKHIIPALGGKAVAELRVSDITSWRNGLALSAASANQVLGSLRGILDMSVEDSLITSNPARTAKPARAERVARDEARTAMPLDVIDAVRDALPELYRIAVTLSLGLGLRAGELCGLTIDRVDFLRGTVRIDRQWSKRGTGQGLDRFVEPKHGSFRTVPAPPALLAAINAHIAAHGLGLHGLILHRTNGNPVQTPAWSDAWIDAMAAARVPAGSWTPHSLRHAFGSYQLAAGHREPVAAWMGHANLATFLTVYAHDIESDDVPADLDAIERPATDRAHQRAQGRSRGALKVV